MPPSLIIITGLGIAAFGLWDQFWTLLGEGGGAATRRVSKGVWMGSRAIYRVWPQSRILSAGGVCAILSTLGCWVFFQWIGWTLVFVGLHEGVVDATDGSPADVWERAYFAGYTLSTLGIGDIQPRGGGARILTAAVSFNGLILLSSAVGYLVPVIAAATDKRRVSITASCMGECSTALLANHWNGTSFDSLEPLLRSLLPDLARLEQQHIAYPVLPYLHSHKRAEAIGPMLAVLDEAMTTISCGLSENAPEAHLAPGTVHNLRRALSTLIETLKTASEIEPADVPPPPSLDSLRASGVPLVSDAVFNERVQDLAERRRTLNTLVRCDGWEWADVSTTDTDRDDEQLATLYDTNAL